MIDAAIADRIRDAVARGAVMAMSLSGGKDSTAAAFAVNAVLDAAGHPRSRRIAVHADLGSAEWRETPATVEAVAAALGLQLSVVRQTRHDLVGRWHDRFERGLARYAALETRPRSTLDVLVPTGPVAGRYSRRNHLAGAARRRVCRLDPRCRAPSARSGAAAGAPLRQRLAATHADYRRGR